MYNAEGLPYGLYRIWQSNNGHDIGMDFYQELNPATLQNHTPKIHAHLTHSNAKLCNQSPFFYPSSGSHLPTPYGPEETFFSIPSISLSGNMRQLTPILFSGPAYLPKPLQNNMHPQWPQRVKEISTVESSRV